MANELFKQLVNKWALRYYFDPMLIDQDESRLMRDLFKHFSKNEEVVLFGIFYFINYIFLEIFHRTF